MLRNLLRRWCDEVLAVVVALTDLDNLYSPDTGYKVLQSDAVLVVDGKVFVANKGGVVAHAEAGQRH